MDKVTKFLSDIIGASIQAFILRVVVAGLLLWTGSATSVGDTIGIILNKDRELIKAVELINATPTPELKAVVAEEATKE
jgi:hypothetical protein